MKPRTPPLIKRTTLIGFTLIITIFVLVGIVSWIEIHSLTRLTSIIYRHPLTVSNAALRASMSVVKMHRSMKDVVLADEQLPIDEAIHMVNEEEKIVYQNLDIIKNRILGAEGQALIRETIVFFKDWRPIREEVISLVRKGQKEEAASITKGKGAQYELMLENKMLELTAYARRKADGFINNSKNVHQRASYSIVIIVTAGALLSVIIAFLTTRQIMYAFKMQKKAEEEKILLINKLQKTLKEVKTLRGLIPICASCKKIRDDTGFWGQVETYLKKHSEIEFTHAICPECAQRLYPELYTHKDNKES